MQYVEAEVEGEEAATSSSMVWVEEEVEEAMVLQVAED